MLQRRGIDQHFVGVTRPQIDIGTHDTPGHHDIADLRLLLGRDEDVIAAVLRRTRAVAKVPKAQGPDARTVAEIVAKRIDLRDKPVTVRGKVVKFTSNVMGKNWVHLRDGSGSSKDDTHDVLVTTKDQAQVGNVVVAKGVVRTDVDLGSGYTYKVLIENVTLQ